MNEKLIQRKLRARRKFKQIARCVIRNLYWLMDSDDMQIGDNVKQNITLIYSGKRKKSGGITLEEKCLLRKPAKWRTREEKIRLYRSLGGLKCFRHWPDHVKFKLVSCTYFVFYDEDRIIVKQNRRAEALYFILSGQVNVLQESIDEVTGKSIVKQIGLLGPGTMFGEVSLLKKVPRTATIVTVTPCEFITVDQEDFDDTLEKTLKRKWDEIKTSLTQVPYFNSLNEHAITECCLLAKINQFQSNEVIYDSEYKKIPAMAYFILSGICKVIEFIYVEEKKGKHGKHFELYHVSKDSETDKSIITSEDVEMKQSELEDLDDITPFNDIDTDVSKKSTLRYTLHATKEHTKQEIYNKCPIVKGLLHNYAKENPLISEKKEKMNNNFAQIPKHVKSHILEICTLSQGACFFENKVLENRKVISTEPVKLLIVPNYWLQLHNKAEIWLRIQTFMAFQIPSTNQAFEIFKYKQKWKEFRKKVWAQAVKKACPNNTTLADVPYSIRISEEY